ncbi:MAG: hypothetical protein ETSY1_35840 [Candidatus Entotheonella factor]|uniref:Uncharacterized protein n=1 Tax=Entotheonella factor TaxID=1429438 RepID=W4L810_ENTF1|nr:MAG: hypothetical protein ETSY1_35840 [Candidatus Entotheonella factor]
MNTEMARIWLVVASLIIVAACFMFFILAPLFGYPLESQQAIRLLEIVLPVFLGYLGSASYFVFKRPHRSRMPVELGTLTSVMIRGPVIVFCLVVISAIFAFGYTNRFNATPRTGLSIDMLAGMLAAALGLLTVTTNLMVSYIFSDVEGELG